MLGGRLLETWSEGYQDTLVVSERYTRMSEYLDPELYSDQIVWAI